MPLILLILFLMVLIGAGVLLAAQKHKKGSAEDHETDSVSEIKKDMDLMVQEIKSLYAEKSALHAENKKLKEEIESLKKK